MRITVDISPAVHHHAGLGRYAHELVEALTRIDSANAYQTFYHVASKRERPDSPLDRLPAHPIHLSPKPWRMGVLLADYAHVGMDRWLPAGDIFHATEHLLPPLRSCKTVFTIHDLIFLFFPEFHMAQNRWYLSLMLPRFLRRADAIIAVSKHTRDDVVQQMHIPPEKITVIYEGVDPALCRVGDPRGLAAVRAKYHLPDRFLLNLGTIEPRKNLLRLLEAFRTLCDREQATPDLVIAGARGWLDQPVFDYVQQWGLQRRVHFAGRVEQADVPALLSAADVFVFPSLYEGFGRPPLEAMACGAPVVCSNAASLPEVVGDAALLVDPRSTEELVAALSRVLSDTALCETLRRKSLAQAAMFSWERAARETLQVYEAVCRP